MQQSLDASQADTELLSDLLGCGARPVEVDHDLEIIWGEAITQPSRPDYTLRSEPGARAVVMSAI